MSISNIHSDMFCQLSPASQGGLIALCNITQGTQALTTNSAPETTGNGWG